MVLFVGNEVVWRARMVLDELMGNRVKQEVIGLLVLLLNICSVYVQVFHVKNVHISSSYRTYR